MQESPRTAWLCLESASGDRAASLLRAVAALIAGDLALTSASSIYETESSGDNGRMRPLTMIVSVTARRLEPFSLLNFCQAAETRLGRQRMLESGECAVTIELLMLGDTVIEEQRNGIALTLPHPQLHLRRSWLTPLAEIAPHLKHPVLGETMAHLRGAVHDTAKVLLYRA